MGAAKFRGIFECTALPKQLIERRCLSTFVKANVSKDACVFVCSVVGALCCTALLRSGPSAKNLNQQNNVACQGNCAMAEDQCRGDAPVHAVTIEHVGAACRSDHKQENAGSEQSAEIMSHRSRPHQQRNARCCEYAMPQRQSQGHVLVSEMQCRQYRPPESCNGKENRASGDHVGQPFAFIEPEPLPITAADFRQQTSGSRPMCFALHAIIRYNCTKCSRRRTNDIAAADDFG